MNRLDCAGHAPAISLLAAFALLFSATAADARQSPHRQHAVRTTHARQAVVPQPAARPAPDVQPAAPQPADTGVTLPDPTLSIIAQDPAAEVESPTIVRPSRRIYCVEFARLVSGVALFGDARTWWTQARENYTQLAAPAPGAVMVFATRRTMRSGHVAVVKRLVNPRQVLVDHANWGRDGRIYLNAPVIDVSANNDWSLVRVWNTRAGTMGTTAYAIQGFIAPRYASAN